MKRTINSHFREWKDAKKRKVLLVRGARQVGKTYSVRELGESFENYFEVNFEEEKGLEYFFRESLNPEIICENLSTYFSKPIIPGRTLLFFDEIQSCPNALASLRFFYEKMPELHLIAAGSLLEFAMSEIPSLGVGRIHSLFMYPMSFNEFLMALDHDNLLAMLQKANSKNPLSPPFHRKLIEYLKIYQLIGGMPAVVKTYLKERNIAQCQIELDDLLTTLRDDFAKYKDRSPISRLREVFDSIVYQAGRKFKYSNVDSTSSSRSLKEALDLLLQAGLAYKIFHTSARGLPLGSQIKSNKFKVILFDVGMHQRLLGLDLKEYLLSDKLEIINRGNLAELFTGLELINNASPGTKKLLYYWHRESRGSNAEVDYVIQEKNRIVPIEVKAGTSGQMQSMFVFLNERNLNMGIRVSLENFSSYGKIVVVPLYAIKHIVTGSF